MSIKIEFKLKEYLFTTVVKTWGLCCRFDAYGASEILNESCYFTIELDSSTSSSSFSTSTLLTHLTDLTSHESSNCSFLELDKGVCSHDGHSPPNNLKRKSGAHIADCRRVVG